MTDPEQIAGQLTEAQRDALRGRYSWKSPHEEDEGERALYRLGLWNPRPKYGDKVITETGLAVRALLEKQYADR